MSSFGKKDYRDAILSGTIYPILFALTIVFLCMRGMSDLKDIYIVNVSVDLFGMLMGYVLYICCLFDVRKNGVKLKYFFYLINVSYLGLFTDACAWLVDGVPDFRIVNIIDNTFYFACAPLQAYFFALYVMQYLRVEEKYRVLRTVLHIGMCAGLIARTANLFFGQYFTVSAEGIYQRSAFYPISMIYIFGSLIVMIVVIIKERRKFKTYQLVVFGIYIAAPFLAGIFTIFVYGISISAGVLMLVLLLMYCALNITQGREKMAADRDLKLASAIQENMLPKTFPFLTERTEFDIYATMTPAKEVGGDFYDFFMIDDDHIGLIMADVSGKGIPAALFMMVSRTMIKNYTLASKEYSPSKILYEVNNQLCESNIQELFVTVWFAIVSLSTGEGVATNAGHEHPVLQKKGGKFELVKYKHSIAVAVLDDMKFEEHTFKLDPGDCVFVYTDGVAEANDADANQFGTDRLLDALNVNPEADTMEVLDNVMSGIKGFVKGADQFDDITMMAFRYFGPDNK